MVIVLPVIERLLGRNIPTWVYITVLVLFFLWACYLTWRDAMKSSVSALDPSRQRRLMIIDRLSTFLKEFPVVTPAWYAINDGAGGGVNEVAQIHAHNDRVTDFLSVHYPEGLKRFERRGTLGLEELLHELLIEDDPTKPQIKGVIEEVYIQWAVPDGNITGKYPMECVFTIKARVVNVQPVPTTLRFDFSVKAPKADCKTRRSSLAGLLFKHEQHGAGFLPHTSAITVVTEEMPDLETICKKPLTQGEEREGWLRFVLSHANNPIRKNVYLLRLIVKDAYGGEWPILSEKSQWREAGEIVTKAREEFEQVLSEIQKADKAKK